MDKAAGQRARGAFGASRLQQSIAVRVIMLLVIMLTTASCVVSIKNYEGAEVPEHQVCGVYNGGRVRIALIDGRSNGPTHEGVEMQKWMMLPGDHTIVVTLPPAYVRNSGGSVVIDDPPKTVQFICVAGRDYYLGSHIDHYWPLVRDEGTFKVYRPNWQAFIVPCSDSGVKCPIGSRR